MLSTKKEVVEGRQSKCSPNTNLAYSLKTRINKSVVEDIGVCIHSKPIPLLSIKPELYTLLGGHPS